MLNKKNNQRTLQIDKENNKKTLSDFRIWIQSKDNMTDDLFDQADKEMNTIQKSTISLCEDEKNIPISSKAKPNKLLFIHSQSMNNLQAVSPLSQRMLHDVYSTIKSINNSTNEIIKLNSLYFSPKRSSITSSENLSNHSTTNQFNQKNLPKIISPTPRENKISNFHYVTNNFRKQLTKAFMNFNPLIHLENMKMLQEADPDINNDINKLKEMINQDLAEITDKHYHRKRYVDYIKRKKLIIQPSTNYDQVKEAEDSKAKCLTTRGTNRKMTKSMPHLFKTRSNKTFAETKKKFPFKDLRIKELENMQTSLKLIDEILTEDYIANNINEHIKEQKEQVEHSEQYKYQLFKVQESLRDIQKLKLKNSGREEGAIIFNKIKKENELYLKKIPGMKQTLLEEIIKTKQ